MKIILLIGLLSLASCSTYLRTSGSRMISPEAHGKLGKGTFDLARIQGSKQYQMDFSGSSTKVPLNSDGVTYGYSMSGELGILKRLDLYLLPSFVMSPTLFGIKFQFLGDSRAEAKQGNFSASISAAGGSSRQERKDAEDDADIFDGRVDKIDVQMDHQEISLTTGYRWTEHLVHYLSATFYEEEARGKVTNNSATLVDASFKYNNNGAIYSTGVILYAGNVQFKAEYSHLTTDWTYNHKDYTNVVNAGMGFNW